MGVPHFEMPCFPLQQHSHVELRERKRGRSEGGMEEWRKEGEEEKKEKKEKHRREGAENGGEIQSYNHGLYSRIH